MNNAGKENRAVSINFLRLCKDLTNLNNLVTLKTLKTLISYGPAAKIGLSLLFVKLRTISSIEERTTKKSN